MDPAAITNPPQTGAQQFVYSGRLGELYRIFIINLLLSLVTLTIFRFWGKTNMRRYIWSSMSLQGQPFEYTGTGGELFKGFLIVMAMYLVVYLGLLFVGIALGDEGQVATQLLLGFFIAYLVFAAQYAAQRYRLTRTLWSGVRGGMTGSAWTYAFKALIFALLSAATFGLCGPWTQVRLAEDRFNNAYFGDGQGSLSARAGPLMGPYLLGYVLSILGLGILIAAIIGLLKILGGLDVIMEAVTANIEGRPADVGYGETRAAMFQLVVALLLAYVGFAFVIVVAFAPYAAAFFRELARGLGFPGLSFRSRVGAIDYLSLWLGNIAIVVFTVGLGLPIAIHRSLKFFANRLDIHGIIDADRLRQASLHRPKTGEGLLEVFDPGFL